MTNDDLTKANILHAKVKDGVPSSRYLVPFRNIRDALGLHAKTASSKTYLIGYDQDGTRIELSYGDFTAKAHQVANLLYDDLKIKRGERVVIIGHNHVDVVIIYMACWIVGATVAPQNVAEDDKRIAFILRNSGARLAFVLGDYIERSEHIIKGGNGDDGELGAPNIEGVIQVGGTPRDGYLQFYDVVKNRPITYLGDESGAKSGDVSLLAGNENAPTLEDEALLVYTSGTTGTPKGVVLTQYNLLVDAQGIAQWHPITGNQRLMCVLPIHHVNGIVMTLITPMTVGASTVLNHRFSVKTFWERIAKERVQIVSAVPTLLQFLLDEAKQNIKNGDTLYGNGINRLDLKPFRYVICGAGTLPIQLAKDFENTFGFKVIHGYGLSETTCFSCFLPPNLAWDEHQLWMQDYGYPSIGCAIAPNEMAIFHPDGEGQRLAAGQRGEICVRGHNVMQGYYNRPDANRETFKFGWFRTGDEGFYEEDAQGRHFFFISGRIKELINRGGVKFSPFDIEEVLLSIEGVKVGLAIGFENDYYGDEVGAYIVLDEGASLSEEEIIAKAREQLTFEKSPKVVVFGTEIPVTSTGKWQRLRLRDLFLDHKGTQFRK